MRVLADAELILSAFQENEHTFDAEVLLAGIMPFEQIKLYITDLCLDKIRYYDEFTANVLEEKFKGNILPYDNCLIKEEILRTVNITRNFECAVEAAWAIANNIGIVITHKPQDFLSADLQVWTVNNLLAITSCNTFVCEVLLQQNQFTNIHRNEYLMNIRQAFDAEFKTLLIPGSSSAHSILGFIQRNLHQFNLSRRFTVTTILNEAYVRGVKQIEKGEYIEKPIHWVRTTSYNIIREYSRERNRICQLEQDVESPTNCSLLDLKDINGNLEKVLLAFEKLDEEEKDILRLKIVEKLTWKEIIQVLELKGMTYKNEAALRKCKEKALKHLRKIYFCSS